MIKCLTDYYYREIQFKDGKKKIEPMECNKCPIEESCKSQHKEEVNAGQDN